MNMGGCSHVIQFSFFFTVLMFLIVQVFCFLGYIPASKFPSHSHTHAHARTHTRKWNYFPDWVLGTSDFSILECFWFLCIFLLCYFDEHVCQLWEISYGVCGIHSIWNLICKWRCFGFFLFYHLLHLCSLASAKTFPTILKRREENGHSRLVPNVSGNQWECLSRVSSAEPDAGCGNAVGCLYCVRICQRVSRTFIMKMC